MVEAENQAPEASSEVAASDPKQLARQLLSEGLDVDAVAEESGLSRPVVLGISGAMKKAQKKLAATEDKAAKGSPSDLGEEESLVSEFRGEAKVDAAALLAARNRNRLRQVGPEYYSALHGTQGDSSPSAKLIDLEIIRQLKDMRQTEEHRNNGGGVEATETLNLRKEVTDLREALRQKDLQNLRDENAKINEELKEIRSEMRSSVGSTSDLAIVVKESKDLLSQVISHDGPLRAYLMPDNINIGKKADAPPLLHAQAAVGNGSVIQELQRHGLTTRILPRSDLT